MRVASLPQIGQKLLHRQEEYLIWEQSLSLRRALLRVTQQETMGHQCPEVPASNTLRTVAQVWSEVEK